MSQATSEDITTAGGDACQTHIDKGMKKLSLEDIRNTNDLQLRQQYYHRLVQLASDFKSAKCQVNALRLISELLADVDAPVQQFVALNLLPLLLNCLRDSQNTPQLLQYEAACVLTNLTTTLSQPVIDAGGVPILIDLMSTPDVTICELAIKIIGNIISDGPEQRDFVISAGFTEHLAMLLKQPLSLKLLRTIAWSVVIICRCKSPPPSLDLIYQLLPHISLFLLSGDDKTISKGLVALRSLCSLGDQYNFSIVKCDLMPTLVGFLKFSEKQSVLEAVLEIITNIAAVSDLQTQICIDNGVLNELPTLLALSANSTPVYRSISTLVSHFLAGNHAQIDSVIQSNVLALLIERMMGGEEFSEEHLNIVRNFTLCCNRPQMQWLSEQKIVILLCRLLSHENIEFVTVALECLFNLLRSLDDITNVLRDLIDNGGLQILQSFKDHENVDIRAMAIELFMSYFGFMACDDDKIQYNANKLLQMKQVAAMSDELQNADKEFDVVEPESADKLEQID